MLSLPEKVLFTLAVVVSGYLAIRATRRLFKILSMGRGKPNFRLIPKRIWTTIITTITLRTVWNSRPIPSLFHGLVAWGFIYYLLVNLGDTLQAFIPGFKFFGNGTLGNLYRLGADLLTVGALVGMTALMFRRFLLRPENLNARKDILLHEFARKGIKRDSLIVGSFIMLHVGFRFLGESFQIALSGEHDLWQPFANRVAMFWVGINPPLLIILVHISFWIALGLILFFIPYFPYSKHIHIFFAPLNFLFKPFRNPIGVLDTLNFEDESIEQFGVHTTKDLRWDQIMDAYACIMCYRCQDVCPAYNTGKVLSPAALEINKRYFLNRLQSPEPDSSHDQPLLEYAITPEAVWACTACGACVDICPVGNEPMVDIIDIRRSLVLMENNFPEELQSSFRGMERTSNPWNISQNERIDWIEGLNVPTVEQNPDPEYLWWVGCAPATDPRAKKVTRALAKILNQARINYAILGKLETCTGDSARRAGNEYLFYELASANVSLLNDIMPKKILTTCPHCLHTIMNEYPAFGGYFEVVHHSQLISELITSGRLLLNNDVAGDRFTYHDPCYLGRQNKITKEPRLTIQQTGAQLLEMKRAGDKSFCCGAGGAQMWKEEENGTSAINHTRLVEAQSSGAENLAVSCPFCMIMLGDAAKDLSSDVEVLDIAEIIAAQLDDNDNLDR